MRGRKRAGEPRATPARKTKGPSGASRPADLAIFRVRVGTIGDEGGLGR